MWEWMPKDLHFIYLIGMAMLETAEFVNKKKYDDDGYINQNYHQYIVCSSARKMIIRTKYSEINNRK